MSAPRKGRGKVRSEGNPPRDNKDVSMTTAIDHITCGMSTVNISGAKPGITARDAASSSKENTIISTMTASDNVPVVHTSAHAAFGGAEGGAISVVEETAETAGNVLDMPEGQASDQEVERKKFTVKKIPANLNSKDLFSYLTKVMPGQVLQLDHKDDTATFHLKSSGFDINWQQVDTQLVTLPWSSNHDRLVVEPQTDTVIVTWLSDKVNDEMLSLYFSNDRRTGMSSTVSETIYRQEHKKAALVQFTRSTAAEIAALCKKRHELAGTVASVSPWFGSQDDLKKSTDWQRHPSSLETEGRSSLDYTKMFGRVEFPRHAESGELKTGSAPRDDIHLLITFYPEEIPLYTLLKKDWDILSFPMIKIDMERMEVTIQGSATVVKHAKDVLRFRKSAIVHSRQYISPGQCCLLNQAGGTVVLEELLHAEDIVASVELSDRYLEVYVSSGCEAEAEFALSHILNRKLVTEVIPLCSGSYPAVSKALASMERDWIHQNVLVEVHRETNGQLCPFVTVQGFKPGIMQVLEQVQDLVRNWRDDRIDHVNGLTMMTASQTVKSSQFGAIGIQDYSGGVEGGASSEDQRNWGMPGRETKLPTSILRHPRDAEEVMCTVELPLARSVIKYAKLVKLFTHDLEDIFRQFNGYFYIDWKDNKMCYKHPKSVTNAADLVKTMMETSCHTETHSVCQEGCFSYFTEKSEGKNRLTSLEKQYMCAVVLTPAHKAEEPLVPQTSMTRGSRQEDRHGDTDSGGHNMKPTSQTHDKQRDNKHSKDKHGKGAFPKPAGAHLKNLLSKGKKLIYKSTGPGDTEEYYVGNVKLILKKGDITKCKVTVLVNPVNTSLKLDIGHLSKIVLEKAGPQLQKALSRKKPHPAPGEIVMTKSYQMSNCQFIYHAALPYTSANHDRQVLQHIFTEALTQANIHGSKSIAFPAIGCGAWGFPVDMMVEEFLHSLYSFAFSGGTVKLEFVTLCIFDKSTFQEVKGLLDESLNDDHSTGQDAHVAGVAERGEEMSNSDTHSCEVGADCIDEAGTTKSDEGFLKWYASKTSGSESVLFEITAKDVGTVQTVKDKIDEMIKANLCEMICKPPKILSSEDERRLSIVALQNHVIYMTDKRTGQIYLRGVRKNMEEVCERLKLTVCDTKKSMLTPPTDGGQSTWFTLSDNL